MKEKRINRVLEENPLLYHLISKKITKKIKAIHGIEYPILMMCLGLDVGRTIGARMCNDRLRKLFRSIFTNFATDKAIKTGVEEGFYTLEPHNKNSFTILLTPKGENAITLYKDYTHQRVKEVYLGII